MADFRSRAGPLTDGATSDLGTPGRRTRGSCILIGRPDDARRAGARARAALADAHDAYSRALVHASLAELAQAFGEADQASALAAESRRWWDADRRYCVPLRDTLLECGPLAA